MRGLARPLLNLSVLGIVTVLATGLLTVVLGEFRFGGSTTYRAEFTTVSGLRPGELVRVAGVDVGSVADVSVHDGERAMVTFTVDDSRPLLRGTRAVVRYKNLVGDRFLELADGPGEPVELGENEVIPLANTRPALDLDQLFNGFKPLLEGLNPTQLNQLSTDLVKVLQGESSGVETLLARVASVTTTLADRDAVIGRVIGNLNGVLDTVDQNHAELDQIITGLDQLVGGLAGERQQIGAALVSIDDLTATTSGVLGEVRPPLHGAIEELDKTSKTLAENTDTIDLVLRLLPDAYARLARTGGYGNYTNIYLCSLQVKLTGPDGNPITTPWFNSNDNTQRCR